MSLPLTIVFTCARARRALPGILAMVVLVLLTAPPASAISPNGKEAALAQLIAAHRDQGRGVMVYNETLNMVARAKARDLASRRYFGHVDPDGYGPNVAVRLANYTLPKWWGQRPEANFIESLAGGHHTAREALEAWLDSPSHRRHVLAEDPFYRQQTYYGIGYARVPGSPYETYWVFVSCPPDDDATYEPLLDWQFSNSTPANLLRSLTNIGPARLETESFVLARNESAEKEGVSLGDDESIVLWQIGDEFSLAM